MPENLDRSNVDPSPNRSRYKYFWVTILIGLVIILLTTSAPVTHAQNLAADGALHDLNSVPGVVHADPCFEISGTVTRFDRVPRAAGWEPTIGGFPVRSAVVRLMESDTISDDEYGETTTDENGKYVFDKFCDDDGFFDDTLEVYVVLRAELRAGGDTIVEVEDSSYIDEVYEYEQGLPAPSSVGGKFTVDFVLNEEQSGVFNIADSIYDAWNFWNESGGEHDGDTFFDYAAEVHYEPGYGDEGSYYSGDVYDEITIEDSPGDHWDDSVIIHEWGHMTDDKYGCDDSEGGPHSFNKLYSNELAWSEGWGNYLQSVVREEKGYKFGKFYVDAEENDGVSINLETWDVGRSRLVSPRNEVSVAALLWDLYDDTVDGQDKVGYGHGTIQDLFTDSNFTNNGFFDDDCDAIMFARAWVESGRPADGPTAAVFEQNIGLTFLPSSRASSVRSADAVRQTQQLLEDIDASYKWWNQTLFVVDNSASMGQNGKLDAVKSVIRQQTAELEAAQEKGVEFNLQTFSNSSSTNQAVFAGQFYADAVDPYLTGISGTGGSDSDCQVNAFDALAQALEGEKNVDAWVYTDGDTTTDKFSAESMQSLLADRNVRASFVTLGNCAPAVPVNGAELQNDGSSAYLPTPPTSPEGGIVPYLMTAIGSGGQFLNVSENQLANAQAILLAQITHSAGAGRWSDYVSDKPTYRFDELTVAEYEWIDATNGQNNGKPGDNAAGNGVGRGSEGFVDIDLQATIDLYGFPVTEIRAYENGALVGHPFINQSVSATNAPLTAGQQPLFALIPFWDDLEWDNRFPTDGGGGLQTPSGYQNHGTIYSKLVNRWQVIQYFGFGTAKNVKIGLQDQPVLFDSEEFEVLINIDTGEIRYQYRNLDDGLASATVGLRGLPGVHADPVQIAHNDTQIDPENGGFKFVPVPPQPTKTYTVAVDSLMEGVGFLLTGYSGSFEPLVIRDPAGTKIDLTDSANVLALDLGLVQYVQVDVDGRTGDWTVDVTAGSSGEGTFAFSSMATSPITTESPTSRSLSTGDVHTFLVDLGSAADGNQLTGYLRTPQGEKFGLGFSFYDDGAHGDGKAGDGLFGSDGFGAPAPGAAYLVVEGSSNGTAFIRTDDRPFRFQPLSVKALADGVNTGFGTPIQFEIRNDDTADHCYELDISVPEGWSAVGLSATCVDAGQSKLLDYSIYMGSSAVNPSNPNEMLSGIQGRAILAVSAIDNRELSAADFATITRVRPAASIEISNRVRYLRPNGDQAVLRLSVFDDQGYPVADGTSIDFSTTLGSLPASVATIGGSALVTFTTGSDIGLAGIEATSGAVSVDTTIDIQKALPNAIELTTESNSLAADGTATTELTALVLDRWGDPVAGWPVRVSLQGGSDTNVDPTVGSLNGQVVVEANTDINGKLIFTYQAGTQPSDILIRADLLVAENGGFRSAKSTSQVIVINGDAPSSGFKIFLPMVVR